ncbi:metal-dependent hydrolase [Clostridium bowmanii]|uniref:metal-dependent hydrolase n=1 Tax=Clostridium bowmanii TaxID=132925 RepID=UPI001C0B4DCC|nr:metal-dependent hydrolase [Clostridium bowmanii]MBU3191498.1 metal-dependent hydrolase [Clostridium bowmanii]MCA1075802.1 metal-dependent hydrolase [Clostridium bowmanii]
MNGKSHQKIAMLSYAIVATIPSVNSLPIFNNSYIHIHIPMGISLIGLVTAGLSGLLVDADSQHSKINHMNPLTGTSNKVINNIEKILKFLLRLFLGVGLGALILWYSQTIIGQLVELKYIGRYAPIITYSISFILIFLGVSNERIFKRIPIIGSVYKKISAIISVGSNDFVRISMFLTYAGGSAILAIYNFTNSNDPFIYIICILLIGIATFPHRSFLHSIEGVTIFTISASYVFNKLGYEYLTGCFFVGYISHIYWADILTKEGVPLLSMPRFIAQLFKKLGFHNKFVHALEKIGKFKVKLPPHITTGSDAGNLFEVIYILVLFAVLVIGFTVYGGKFTVI